MSYIGVVLNPTATIANCQISQALLNCGLRVAVLQGYRLRVTTCGMQIHRMRVAGYRMSSEFLHVVGCNLHSNNEIFFYSLLVAGTAGYILYIVIYSSLKGRS